MYLNLKAQAPYIAVQGGDGLGQYGYLETKAVTFARLERNTYDNIAYLSARWWVSDNNAGNGNGIEYLYHVYAGPDWNPMIGWQCGGDNYPSKRTTDFNAADFAPEWRAGADCYVSVCAKYCDDSYSPPSFNGVTTNGAVGFNERHFRVLDVDNTLHVSTASNIPNTNGLCQTSNAFSVAGSFSIDPGSFTGISISSLILKNSGSAGEVTHIPNAALNIYYEPATGSEVFGDGNESFGGTLYGDWDGNTADNIYGSTALNIPVNGKVRVYVLLCSFNSPTADGQTINLGFVNDGIFLSPAMDGFTKMRINPASISQRNIVLPLRFLNLAGTRKQEQVQLKWNTVFDTRPEKFIIQQSASGIDYTDAGVIAPGNSAAYAFTLNTAAEYFRVIALYNNGERQYSNTIRVRNNNAGINVVQNPISSAVIFENKTGRQGNYSIILTDVSGRLLARQKIVLQPGINTVNISNTVSSQVLLLQLSDEQGGYYNFKLLKQ
jgi:hypothetical protein